ncbi:MAG: hypothetical protein AAFZ17_10380 [Cyanobacteria bacterium J06650_10]
MDFSKESTAAQAYLALPNTLLQALGGACYLRKTVEASQFEILHSWPSFSELPFGISFRFRIQERCYRMSLSRSVIERDRYCLDIYCNRYSICKVSKDKMTLDAAAAQFFEFTQILLPT